MMNPSLTPSPSHSPAPSLPRSPAPLRLCYVLLSPTFGMHQYTADYANRMVAAGHEVHLVTTSTYPADRYAPGVQVHTPVTTTDTGFSLRALLGLFTAWKRFDFSPLSPFPVPTSPPLPLSPPHSFDVVHFTGPHLWNPFLLSHLRRLGIPTLHSLHDLDPHPGSAYGPLLHLWNTAVLRGASHILVHGQRYRDRLARYPVTCLPLLHLFLGYEVGSRLGVWEHEPELPALPPLSLSPALPFSPPLTALFFGRLEPYKGVTVLLEAWARARSQGLSGRLILAGEGDLTRLWAGELPPGVELRNRRLEDAEALTLFQQCSLVVLPYTGATQSALIPAAYFFGKPVIATRSGALEEYVEEGRTGWLVPPGDPLALARALQESLGHAGRLQDFGQNGRLWYTTRRTCEETSLLQLYKKMCEQGDTAM